MNFFTDNWYKNNIALKKSNYISVFLLVYFSSSFYGLSIQGNINIVLILATSIVTFLSNNNRKIKLNSVLLLLFIISSSLCTLVINSDGMHQYLIFLTYLFAAYVFYISIDIRSFVVIYTKIMYFISIFSLVTFLILLIFPTLFNYLPSVTNKAGLTMQNAFFSVVYDSGYFNSNFGPFWEPGAFQTFINFALFFQIFILKDLDPKKTMVFLITIFTTFSTTGYISAFILIIIFIFLRGKTIREEMVNRKKLIFMLIGLLAVGIIIFNSLSSTIMFKVFGKLEAIINPDLVNENPSYVSTMARTDSIKIPLINVLNNPFFGVGFTNLSHYTLGGNTNFLTATPLNWFGLFGIPIGIILNICVWRWTRVISGSIFIKIIAYFFLSFIALSEYYNMNAFYLVFLFYSFDINRLVKNNHQNY